MQAYACYICAHHVSRFKAAGTWGGNFVSVNSKREQGKGYIFETSVIICVPYKLIGCVWILSSSLLFCYVLTVYALHSWNLYFPSF